MFVENLFQISNFECLSNYNIRFYYELIIINLLGMTNLEFIASNEFIKLQKKSQFRKKKLWNSNPSRPHAENDTGKVRNICLRKKVFMEREKIIILGRPIPG